MDALALGLAWVGSALLVLSDGARGRSLGLTLASAGLALGLGRWGGGLLLVAGGLLAALVALLERPSRWELLRPGSTPRLILCLIVGAAMAWVGGSLLAGPSPTAARMAVLVGGGIAGARLISVEDPAAGVAAGSAMALAAGSAAALVAPGVAPLACGAGAVAATAVTLLWGPGLGRAGG